MAAALYDLGDTAFTDPASGTTSEVRAVVHYPRQLDGKLPLIVMSHGSWSGCDTNTASWPCPAGSHPFPSYRGYDYLGDALAARGFVVVSISVDAINQTSFDYADRAHLINHHLQLWRQLASTGRGPLAAAFTDAASGRPVDPPFHDHVDMTDVGTMGHSRGGKGVMWQASDKHRAEWPAGVQVRAVVPLAPVKFDDPEGDNSDTLVTSIPFAVVTGTCDGAVGEAGKQYLSDVAGRNTIPDYGLSLRDANHDYYNTEWSVPHPGLPDQADDSTCPAAELTPDQQRTATVAYLVAFYERYLKGNPAGEPVLTGQRPLPGVTSDAQVQPPKS